MKEKFLLRCAFVCAFVGLIGLFIVTENIGFKKADVSKISNELGSDVVVQGEISSLREFEKTYLIEIKQKDMSMDIVVFKPASINLSEGEEVKIYGEVQEYEGSMNIVAYKIQA